MNVVLINILDTESIHHDRASRYGFRQIFLAMAISTDRVAVGDPVTRIKIVDGIFDDQIAGAFDVVVPCRPRSRRARRPGSTVSLCLDHKCLTSQILRVDLPNCFTHGHEIAELLTDLEENLRTP